MQINKYDRKHRSILLLFLTISASFGLINVCEAQEPGITILRQLGEKNLEQALETLGTIAGQADLWSSDDQAGLSAAGGGIARALAQLDENERYNLLYRWSMPADDRKTVRIFTTCVPREAPPEVFARVLRERPRETSFPISSIGGVPGLFSTGWTLVKSADGLGRLNRLTTELEELVQQDIPNADVLLMLARLANRRIEEKTKTDFEALAAKLTRSAQSLAPEKPAIHLSQLALAAAALNHEELQPLSVSILQGLVEQANSLGSPRALTFVRLAHAVAVQTHLGKSGPEFLQKNRLKYWIPVSNMTAHSNAQGAIPAMWLTHEEHILHLTGSDCDALLFRYPLTGEFDFTCETQEGGAELTDGGLVYGGLQFQAEGRSNQLAVWDAGQEHVVFKSCPFVRHEPARAVFNRVSIRSKQDQNQFASNLHPVWFDHRAAHQSPWLGLRSHGAQRPMFRNFKLTGSPLIPRTVSLSDGDELRGWEARYFFESQPRFTGNPDLANAANIAAAQPALPATDWKMTSGIIEAQKREVTADENRQSLMRYQRPLLDGESINYEFFHQENELEVHPALGKLAFLVEPGGVRIRWITDGKLEWTGLPEENATLEPLNRRGPRPLPLKENDWNAVSMSLAKGQLTLSLNGTPIYVRQMESDNPRRFGFYRDRTRTARIRNVVMSGDWPEQVPQEFLDHPTTLIDPEQSAKNVSSLHPLSGPEYLADNVNEMRRRAAGMPVPERYQFLKSWVLPSPSHPDIRVMGEFVPTDPSPLARELEPHRFSSERGGELVSPVFDLLETAAELERLEELFHEVNTLPETSSSDQRRAKLALLAMIRLDQVEREPVFDLVERLWKLEADAFTRNESEFLPELILLYRAIVHRREFETFGEMLVRFYEQRFALAIADEWETYLSSLLGDYEEYLEGSSAQRSDHSDWPKLWIPVQRSIAYTRGSGYPPLRWRFTGNQEVRHQTGHHRDYLFYRIPLTGDYEVSAEIHPHGTSQVMVGGHFCGMKGDGKRLIVGRFREDESLIDIDPPFQRHDPWAQYRAVVRDGILTVSLHGRSLFVSALEELPDPWVALRSVSLTSGQFRHLRILGALDIPESVSMSSSKTLSNWIPYYYFSDTAGKPGDVWRMVESPNGIPQILGRKRDGIAGSWFESLLRYHRPLVEDGSIEYDFVYIPGMVDAHPALDRLVFYIESEGVRLHWVTDGRYDRTEVTPDNMLEVPEHQRGSDRLPLHENQLNHVKLSIDQETVLLVLNGELIYEYPLEPANRRTFGLFHFADRTALAVRNVVMRGNWPKTLPPPFEQELVDPRLAVIERNRDRIKAEFMHDFVRDGLPSEYFKRTGGNAEQAIGARADGVHTELVSVSETDWRSASIVPRFSLEGDFDVQARFEGFRFDETLKDAIAFAQTSVNDDHQHYVRAMRGWDHASGHSVRSQLSPLPPGGRRAFVAEKQMDWTTSGRLRIARVGHEFHVLYASEQSSDFRIIQSSDISDAEITMDGILLQLALRGRGSAHVIWKDVSLKAERLKYLPPSEKPLRILSAMNADGSNLRSLTKPAFNLSHLGSPEFSTDGSKIVLDMSTGSTTSSHIVLMNRDGTALKDLGMGCMPSLSEDRKSIVFSVPGEGVVMMDLDGENRKTVDRSGWGVQFSPDGKQIAYGRSSNITLMDVATNEKKLLMTGDVATRYSSIYWNLGWSHDSQAIAFKGRVRTTGQEELAVVALDKPDAVEVLYSGSGINPDFTFSPDNQSVLFAKNTPGQPGPQLYLAHRKAPGEIEFLKGQPSDRTIYDCEWSPDGREIVFSSVQIPGPVDWPIAEQSTPTGQNSN